MNITQLDSYLKKVRFESSLKRCEALNVSDLRRKTVPHFGRSRLKARSLSVGRHSALAGTNKVACIPEPKIISSKVIS